MRLFKRGSGPLISVLLPTRGRPQGLCESLDSLHSLAGWKTSMEFLLKVDDDDPATLDAARKIGAVLAPGQMRIFSSPRGRGYADIHHWTNELARQALGDWLLIWNDDALMAMEKWDQMIASADADGLWHGLDEICLFAAQTLGRVLSTEFLFVRRDIPRILGHLSLSPNSDNWIYSVLRFIGSAYFAPVGVKHNQDTDDAVRDDSLAIRTHSAVDLNSIPNTRARLRDVDVLLRYIETNTVKR